MEKKIQDIKKQLQEQIKQSEKLLKKIDSLKKIARNSGGAKRKVRRGPRLETPSGMWNDFIFETFNKTGKLYTASQMVDLAKSKLSVKDLNKDQLRLGIARVLSRHESRSGKLKLYTPHGKRPSYYGLANWFDVNGKIKPAYSKKIAS